ncbi:16S rRNA processing protein RimM [Halobacteroides halobius DSM 5150]|uniref:Ribosome maturation factor RimM n=1 Tax=Halobacteroides halobius (strain ATCC 35273 / DSM 5150 / MD-1) TaxID=748449 RepID=L0K6E7_HALHC|nr:ribosome maturation factor RimM [Halobacteroides halobius]AGB40601.1 16S rRNA processing protein RimM [Halobacteroides halobius DSM 5150]
MAEKLITIGKITRHQGNKGEVRVKALTDFPEHFKELKEVYLVKRNNKVKVEIENVRYHKGFVILKFINFDDIGKAIEYKDYDIKIFESDTKDLEEGSYYLYQVIGLEVYTNDNDYLGKVEDILETGANDVYIVNNKEEELLIPALKDVIKEIDLDNNKMEVELPAGLR